MPLMHVHLEILHKMSRRSADLSPDWADAAEAALAEIDRLEKANAELLDACKALEAAMEIDVLGNLAAYRRKNDTFCAAVAKVVIAITNAENRT